MANSYLCTYDKNVFKNDIPCLLDKKKKKKKKKFKYLESFIITLLVFISPHRHQKIMTLRLLAL